MDTTITCGLAIVVALLMGFAWQFAKNRQLETSMRDAVPTMIMASVILGKQKEDLEATAFANHLDDHARMFIMLTGVRPLTKETERTVKLHADTSDDSVPRGAGRAGSGAGAGRAGQ